MVENSGELQPQIPKDKQDQETASKTSSVKRQIKLSSIDRPGATGRWEIVNVEEKHGPMHNAIPCMPLPIAIILCIINFGAPGIGTLLSAPLVFIPSVSTRLKNRLRAFSLNILSSFLQMVLFIIIVGWIWSILWGMTMVQLSADAKKPKKTPQQFLMMRRQSSVEAALVQRV